MIPFKRFVTNLICMPWLIHDCWDCMEMTIVGRMDVPFVPVPVPWYVPNANTPPTRHRSGVEYGSSFLVIVGPAIQKSTQSGIASQSFVIDVLGILSTSGSSSYCVTAILGTSGKIRFGIGHLEIGIGIAKGHDGRERYFVQFGHDS